MNDERLLERSSWKWFWITQLEMKEGVGLKKDRLCSWGSAPMRSGLVLWVRKLTVVSLRVTMAAIACSYAFIRHDQGEEGNRGIGREAFL